MHSDALFCAALGERWAKVHPVIQALHVGGSRSTYSGRATIHRGSGIIANAICRLLGFPPAGENVPVRVIKDRELGRELWLRQFGDHVFQTVCTASDRPHHVRERVGVMTFEQELVPVGGQMRLVPRRGWCLGVPIPKALLPHVDAREGADDDTFTFDIRLATPSWLLGGSALLVHYSGWLVSDDAGSTSESLPSSN